MSFRIIISLIGLVLSLEAFPTHSLASGRPPAGSIDVEADVAPSFIQRWAQQLDQNQREFAAVDAAASRVVDSLRATDVYLALPRDEALMESGLASIRAGHLARGLATLNTFLEVEQPFELHTRARTAAARVANMLGEHEAVLEHLAAIRTATDARAALADAATADGSGSPAEAHTEAHTDFVDPSDDLLAPYRSLWHARAALATGRWEEARDAALVASDDTTRPIVHEARFIAAEARLHIEDSTASAIREMDALLVRYPEYPQGDRMQVELARAEQRVGSVTAAARRLDNFLWDRPFSGRAPEARVLVAELQEQGGTLRTHSFETRLAHATDLRRRRHWGIARGMLTELLNEAIEDGSRNSFLNEVRFQLALNAYDSAQFSESLHWMDAIEEAGNVGVSQFNRATWRARPLSRLGREQEAYEIMIAYYAQRSGSERHHRLYEFAFDVGNWDAALTHLDDLYTRDRQWESWNGAFTHYMAGNHDRARRLFATLARRATGTTKSRYEYWQARCLEKLGRIDEALELYAGVTARSPYRYYGLQAHNRTLEWNAVLELSAENAENAQQAAAAGSGAPADEDAELAPLVTPWPAPGRIHWDGFEGEPSADFAALQVDDIDEFFRGYPSEFDDSAALDTLIADWAEVFPLAVTAHALWQIGAVEEARKEFRSPLIEFRALDSLARQGRRPRGDRPIRLSNRRWANYIDNRPTEIGWWGITLDTLRFPVPSGASDRRALAARQTTIQSQRSELRPLIRAVARQLGDFYMVRRFALDDDLPSLTTEPLDIRWHEAYPRAYGPDLFESIERYQLNPFLVWALMIVESDMNPDTVSHADAYGLLQVIPKTGDLVALDFGQIDFGVHDLLEPSESLRYGTWYLNELITKFHGQEMLAMVAYNAGPHQVQRWLEWRGDDMDMDEFIETVPYDGARRYPQRIVQYMSILRAVNGLDRHVYIGNDLDPTFEDNIYF